MKCSYCGYEKNGEFDTCPQCGTVLHEPTQTFTQQPYEQPQDYQQPYGQSPMTTIYSKIGNMLKDQLFLYLCLLLSGSCIWNLFTGGLPVITIILCIFLWIAYFKGQTNTYTFTDIEKIGGTAFASYIVNYILCGLIAICGLYMFSLSSNSELNDTINEVFAEAGIDLAQYIGSNVDITFIFKFVGIVFLVAAVLMLVLNIFGRRYICTFLKSLHQSMINPNVTPTRCVAARRWFYVFAGYYLLDIVYSFSVLTETNIITYINLIAPRLLLGIAWIIAGILIKKYFSEYR